MITENEKTTMNATAKENAKIAHSQNECIADTINGNESKGLGTYDFITAPEISKYLGIGLTQAYAICKLINKKLDEQGYLTFRGKVPKQALMAYLP